MSPARRFAGIDKDGISSVDMQMLSKKAIPILAEGSEHAFDYGALPVDECVTALEAR